MTEIARTKKNRTDEEKCFGIQIDSLADIVCFGILPIVLGFKLGMYHVYGVAILLFYGLAGLIRLAYFNVMEAKRQSETSENRKILIRTAYHIHVCDPAAFVCCIHDPARL